MSYRSETIQTILPRINETFFLPAMQREFVWSEDQICKLFDSLMRRYPISAFLVWNVPAEAQNDLEVYKFLVAVKASSNRALPASISGGRDITLVMDGQQRLTALLVGLEGVYQDKKSGRVTSANHAGEKRLYLNLLHDGRSPSRDGKTEYEFKFFSHPIITTKHQYWLPVGAILKGRVEDGLESFIERQFEAMNMRMDRPLRSDAKMIVEHNLTRLYEAVWKDETISYHTETDQDEKRILEIFIRANSGGTTLSKPDLLLSTLTLHWGDDSDTAKDVFNNFVDELNAILARGDQATAARKNRLTKDFVMKSCLVLLEGNGPIAYKISSFNRDMCYRIKAEWDDISDAIRRAVSAANAFGISGRMLTSANALIPIAYYLRQNRKVTLLGESAQEVANAKRARIWLLSVLLNQVLSGSSDVMLGKLRGVIHDERRSGDFPTIGQFDLAIREAHRTVTSGEEAVDNVLGTKYKDDTDFLALSLLYDERIWDSRQYSIDHLFPQSELKLNRPDIPSKRRDDFANLALIRASENSERGNRPLRQWAETRSPEFLTRHFIPADKSLWHTDKYEEFLTARCRLLRGRVKQVFLVREDAT